MWCAECVSATEYLTSFYHKTLELLRAHIVRWVQPVVGQAETTEFHKDVGQVEHVLLQLKVQVLLERAAFDDFTLIALALFSSLHGSLDRCDKTAFRAGSADSFICSQATWSSYR